VYEQLYKWINEHGLASVLRALATACLAVATERRQFQDGTSEEYEIAYRHLSEKANYWSDI
jgi:hypothetical protein